MKKKRIIIISAISVILTGLILLAVFAGNKTPGKAQKTDKDKALPGEINVEEFGEGDVQLAGMKLVDEGKIEITDVDNVLTTEAGEVPDVPGSTKTGKNAGKQAKPTEGAKPKEDVNVSGGTAEQSQKYNCNTPGHHCAGPEDHAYILNLELEGCPYCRSHSCPSFYAVDKWGNACYTPCKCPKYNAHNDSVYYCQTCGKNCGDGTHGTCVQFIEDCNCPKCGKSAKAGVCHSCS